MDEVRVLGYCTECSNRITDENNVYVNDDGEYFCCVECAIEHAHIRCLEV